MVSRFHLAYVFEHLSEPYIGQHIDEIAFVPNKNSLLSTQGLFMETEKEITNRAPPTINNKKRPLRNLHHLVARIEEKKDILRENRLSEE